MAQAAANKKVTEARRQVIFQVVCLLHAKFACGATGRQVNQELTRLIDNGTLDWPQATWAGAQNKPYLGGTYQHLRAMSGPNGVLTTDRDGFVPGAGAAVAAFNGASPLRQRAADALRLQSEGKNGIQIAELLGISRSLAYSLLNDPTGEKERERKRGYCPACGKKKADEASVCLGCRDRKPQELLPPTTFTEFIERARDYGYDLLFGVTPELVRVIRIGTGRGFFDHEVRHDLTWLDAVHEVEHELGVQLQ